MRKNKKTERQNTENTELKLKTSKNRTSREKEESKDLACREQNNKWQEAIISHKSEKELFL